MKPKIKNIMKGILVAILFVLVTMTKSVAAVDYTNVTADSWISWLFGNSSTLTSGYYNLTVNEETYQIRLYVIEGDTVWDTNQVFGENTDIGER